MLRRILLLCGSLAVLFFALLALAGTFDALNPPGQPQGADAHHQNHGKNLVTSGSRVDRQLCVVVDGQRLQARLELVMPTSEELVKELWRSGAPGGSDLVKALFGTVSVSQFIEWPSHNSVYNDLVFGPPRLVFAKSGTARILTESDTYFFATRQVSLVVGTPVETVASGAREISVDTRDIEMKSGPTDAGLPQIMASASAGKNNTATKASCWTSLAKGMTRRIYPLNASGKGSNAPDAESFVLYKDHVTSLRTADVAGDTVPAINSLLQVSLDAFAYGLAVWYLRRTRLRRPDFRNCVLCTFWLVAATGALWTASSLLFGHDIFGSLPGRFSELVTSRASTTDSPSVGVIYIMVLIGSLAWPLVAATLGLPAPARPSGLPHRLSRTTIPYLTTMATALVAVAVLNEWSQAPLASVWTFLAAAALGAIIAWSLTMFVKCVGAPALSSWGVIVLGVTTVCVAAIAPFAFIVPQRGWFFLPRLTYLLAVLCLIAGGLILLIRNQTPWLARPRRRRFIALITVIYSITVGLLLIPHARYLLQHADPFEVGPWSVLPLVYDFESLLYVIVLFSLFIAMRYAGGTRAATLSAPLHRTLGVIYVILNFYWFAARWLYLPVPVLLGWLLAATWLFPPAKIGVVRTVRRERAVMNISPKEEGRQLLELSRAERRHYSLIAAGTKDELAEAENRLSNARKHASHTALSLRQRFFGVPDATSPWAFGWHGAALGTLIGIPWIGLYLAFLARDGFAYGTVQPESYSALWMFSDLFGVLTQWSLLGFFLGYFFPYLRGANAIAKSICIFVAFALPPVVLALLWERQDMIEPALWTAVQDLAFAFVLGMFMDYRLARRAGIERSAYVEIRGLSTLIGWGGAVIGATITAVFALAQSTAMVYVQNVLHVTSGSAGPTG